MEAKNGKLLVLGGFAIKAFLSSINFLTNLLKISLMSGFLGSMSNLASIFANIAITAGFVVMFLADKNVLDLIIAGGFASGLLSIIANIRSNQVIEVAAKASLTRYVYALIGLMSIAACFVWAFKLFKDTKYIPAIATVCSVVALIFGSLIHSLVGSWTTFMLYSFASVIYAAGLAFVAFLEFADNK